MNSTKYGIKLWSINSDLYPEFIEIYNKKKADYLELSYIPENSKNIQLLIDNNIPIIVHAPMANQKVFFGGNNFEHSNKILTETIGFAKKLSAQKIIIHPGIGTKENFMKFLKMNPYGKITIENMPKMALNGSDCLGYTAEEIKEFLEIGDFDFCLDFAHAIKSAVSQKIDYKPFLKKLMKLNPTMLHISDGNMDNEKDEHLNLGKGHFDLKFIAELVRQSNAEMITFEVPKENGLSNDLKNIEYFKQIQKSELKKNF